MELGNKRGYQMNGIMASHYSILVWKIPSTEGPSGPDGVHGVTKSWT